jgi:hypothetical protein
MSSSMWVSPGVVGAGVLWWGWNGCARGLAAPLPLPLARGGIRDDGGRTQLIKGDGKQIIEDDLLMKSL